MTTPYKGTLAPPPPPQKRQPIASRSEEGREIVRFLEERLGIPPGWQNFSVHFDWNDVIRVDCSYTPKVPQVSGGRSD